jgi:hypothetical protein
MYFRAAAREIDPDYLVKIETYDDHFLIRVHYSRTYRSTR